MTNKTKEAVIGILMFIRGLEERDIDCSMFHEEWEVIEAELEKGEENNLTNTAIFLANAVTQMRDIYIKTISLPEDEAHSFLFTKMPTIQGHKHQEMVKKLGEQKYDLKLVYKEIKQAMKG